MFDETERLESAEVEWQGYVAWLEGMPDDGSGVVFEDDLPRFCQSCDGDLLDGDHKFCPACLGGE